MLRSLFAPLDIREAERPFPCEKKFPSPLCGGRETKEPEKTQPQRPQKRFQLRHLLPLPKYDRAIWAREFLPGPPGPKRACTVISEVIFSACASAFASATPKKGTSTNAIFFITLHIRSTPPFGLHLQSPHCAKAFSVIRAPVSCLGLGFCSSPRRNLPHKLLSPQSPRTKRSCQSRRFVIRISWSLGERAEIVRK